MRALSIAALLTVLGLVAGVALRNEPVANALAQAEGFQPSIAIDKLTANAKNLQDQTFDTF